MRLPTPSIALFRGRFVRQSQSLVLLTVFVISSLTPIPVKASELLLPKPGTMVHLSTGFAPAMLKGIKVFPQNPFQFEFILDKGDGYADSEMVKAESKKLIKYFMASLTTPENDLWVNLSPYEKERIVPDSFGKTDMGRDLLAQDYLLKQITASLMYPEDETGKKFWKRVYEEAAKKFGTTNIPVNTFNKVWIVPAKAVVYENPKTQTAYVADSKLKVMMEEDYLSLNKNTVGADLRVCPTCPGQPQGVAPTGINELGSQIIREIIIPQLEREVNSNKNFAQLRHVYSSLILATWYKKKIRDSILAKVYVDKKKVEGIKYSSLSSPNVSVGDLGHGNALDARQKQSGMTNKDDVEIIYQRYLQAFKKGVYNYIKDPITKAAIPRKYFSGGFAMGISNEVLTVKDARDSAAMIGLIREGLIKLSVVVSAIVQSVGSGSSTTITDETHVIGENDRFVLDKISENAKGQRKFTVHEGRIMELLGELRDELEIEDLDSPEKMKNRLFGESYVTTTHKLYELSSLLRENYPFTISQISLDSNLMYALKEELFFNIAPHVYLTPITGSFKRHLIFRVSDLGVIEYAKEFMIPGRDGQKKYNYGDIRLEVERNIRNAYKKSYSVRVEDHRKMHYKGQLYGQPFDEITDVLLYDYPFDGKRVEMMDRPTRVAWAQKMGISLQEFDRRLVSKSLESYAALSILGYWSLGDTHSGNLRAGLVKGQNGKWDLNVQLVADFQSMGKGWAGQKFARTFKSLILSSMLIGGTYTAGHYIGNNIIYPIGYALSSLGLTLTFVNLYREGLLLEWFQKYRDYPIASQMLTLEAARNNVATKAIWEELTKEGVIKNGTITNHLRPKDKVIRDIGHEDYYRLLGLLTAGVVQPIGLLSFSVPWDEVFRINKQSRANVRQQKVDPTGGIDFKPDKMNMDIKMDSRVHGNDSGSGRSDKAFKFNIDPAMLKKFENAPGFEPVIRSIEPLRSLIEFMGG